MATAAAQHGDYGVTVSAHPPRIALPDNTNGKASELERLHLTDDEVWVDDSASL